MASGAGYTPLCNEDIDTNHPVVTEVLGCSSIMLPETNLSTSTGSNVNSATRDEAPPPYIPAANVELSTEEFARDRPPKYADVVKLPTYNESEFADDNDDLRFSDADVSDDLRLQAVWSWGLVARASSTELTEEQVGSDLGFAFSFMLSFVFNCVGFVISYCCTKSLACHFGAVGGLGLSFVKWTFIIKRSDCCGDYFASSPWLMWFFILIGLIIFVRGVSLYIQLKGVMRMRRNGGRLLLLAN